ncbi:leukocyte-associated immunoglobulin-like receptor 1 isoform X4 [Pteropus medius]|uniref:leukocyte-associated immunoglobulin-like receptor 1 isoform X4 n=1 Tax=Pteropus vampyrus TaxID=132908 RepID=UPI00196A4377|nr:leukocyte-associated immunoglobulin-like receptor 1 isoform X4 [Pteropus giganteus]
MSLHPTTLLGLLLCLGQTIHTWNEVLPKPSICAKTDTVVHRGRPVTIVCQSSAGADRFRLEKKDQRYQYRDETNVSQHGSQGAEARFHITASEVTAGHYFCRYQKGNNWSKISELLELVVTDEDISALPSGSAQLLTSYRGHQMWPQSVNFPRETGSCTPYPLPSSSAGLMHPGPLPQSPAAEDPQEVTYAQLDHQVLTLRAAGAQSLQSTEPTADASTYAALARR